MQTHLKGFGLENFRVFKDYTWFDFAPITILTGPNNSDKSSTVIANGSCGLKFRLN
jgi:AAA15 family ATPase/GTPase